MFGKWLVLYDLEMHVVDSEDISKLTVLLLKFWNVLRYCYSND